MNFDMNRTWSHAVSLVQTNFQLLAILAGVFLLVPSLVIYLAMPDFFSTLQTNTDPDQITAMLAEEAVPFAGLMLFATFCQLIGYAAMISLMGQRRPTVGEALRMSLSRLPTLIGITLLLVVVYAVVAAALAVVLGLLAGLLSFVVGTAGVAILSFFLVIAVLVVLVYVVARFTMTTPAVMLDGVTNPATALKRSWDLTGPFGKRIFVFFLLLMAAYIVISLIISSVLTLVAAAFGGGTGSALVMGLGNGVIGAAVAMIFSGIMVAMHHQLAGIDTQDIGETFD